MVFLTAAALGAAGYGAYKGGEVAVKKGKETKTELERHQKRRQQSSELRSKASTHQERISKLTSMRSGAAAASASSKTEEKSDSRHSDVISSFKALHSKDNKGLKGLLRRGK
jgi:hypothetical protein